MINLTGPRQSGKTTLAKALFPEHDYILLENPNERRHALEDPVGFLNRFKNGVILDEVQRVPDLFSYIQGVVDEDDRPGRFILLFSGFYPRIHDKNLHPWEWLGNYIQTYLERDVKSLINVGDLEVYRRFFTLCAGRSGQILDQESLASDCGVSRSTIKRWLSVLETSFQIFFLRPYYKNFNKRITKRSKLYFSDVGMMCFCLGIRDPKEIATHPLKGAIFETFVVSNFYKNKMHFFDYPSLYFWLESNKGEVDLLFEQGQDLFAFEIKATQTFNSHLFNRIEAFKKIDKQGLVKNSGLIYGGDKSFEFKDHQVISWCDV